MDGNLTWITSLSRHVFYPQGALVHVLITSITIHNNAGDFNFYFKSSNGLDYDFFEVFKFFQF
jgi:hypothetical protein